jgi:protein TonB
MTSEVLDHPALSRLGRRSAQKDGARAILRTPRGSPLEGPLCALAGCVTATALFVIVALTQMLGDIEAPRLEIQETIVAIDAPEVEEFEIEEAPPPEPSESLQLEVEHEAPRLTLDQMDIALNPGTGAGLVGDFTVADLGITARSAMALDDEAFVDFSALDQIPRPIGVSGLSFPSRLRRKRVAGTIVLFLKLGSDGRVIAVSIESSDLPAFDRVVLSQVQSWRFTPPTRDGQPVNAQARLPMPIRIQ